MLDVRPFDGRRATDAEIDEYHELRCAVYRVDIPELPAPARSETAARLAQPQLFLGERLIWFARLGGRLAGAALVNLPVDGDENTAVVHVLVHPDLRRQGIGTRLLHTVTPTLRDRGRTAVQGYDVTKGGAGDQWAKALGFRGMYSTLVQVLRFAEVERGRWDVAVPEGYRLVRWIGVAPDDIVESYATALTALGDAPTGDSGLTLSEWSVDRVRRLEADYAEHGIERRIVLAVTAEGQAAGVTELERRPLNPERLAQGATTVLATHRGHGLGLAMKAAMLRWFTADYDGLADVTTYTGAANVHMVEVNHRLGYETVRHANAVGRAL